MKKNLSIVVLALFAVLNVQAYKGELIYAKTVEGVEMLFTGINDEEVEVGGSVWGACREAVERGTTGVVTIPETVNGYRVTRICDKAFNYCALSGINIPNTVTRIGEEAFFVSSLTELIIPESVNYIGQKAFSWCRKLKNVVIHGKISTLEESTFEHCEELSSVELPEGLITIKQTSSTVIAPSHSVYAGYDYDGGYGLNGMKVPYLALPNYDDYIISTKGSYAEPIKNVTIDKYNGIHWDSNPTVVIPYDYQNLSK